MKRETIKRRYSSEPEIVRPASTTPRTETETFPLNDLPRIPSLPLITNTNRILTSSTYGISLSIDEEEQYVHDCNENTALKNQ